MTHKLILWQPAQWVFNSSLLILHETQLYAPRGPHPPEWTLLTASFLGPFWCGEFLGAKFETCFPGGGGTHIEICPEHALHPSQSFCNSGRVWSLRRCGAIRPQGMGGKCVLMCKNADDPWRATSPCITKRLHRWSEWMPQWLLNLLNGL